MCGELERLRREHAVLERLLDALAEALSSGGEVSGQMAGAVEAADAHYRTEQSFLEHFAINEPLLARQMMAQHEEAREIAARFAETDPERTAEKIALARRFHAIAQHNIIQEERDVFPLAERLG